MYIRVHITPKLGHIPLQKLTTSQLNNFYADMMKVKCMDKEQFLSPRTILRIHNVIHNCLEFAIRDNIPLSFYLSTSGKTQLIHNNNP
ncbi:hypothetical protein [Sporomusa carbonis]|uniref:hypothetical protein n=1 Tax=Sporomusa carbonis TaxID=3076075 RepID=UPI003C7AAFD4